MSLLEKTKFLLRRHRIFPNKFLGQAFTVEPSIFQRMVNYASLNRNDVVLDIGAGLGFLTRFLAGKCKSIVAIESDARLVKVLHEQLKELPNVKIIEGNVLKTHIPRFNKVVSIPPYHISSPLLLWLFRQNFDCAVLVFQKEFAHRLIISVGGQSYGWLGVVAYYYAEVELLDDVPGWIFYPRPEVDSVIVRLKPKKPPPFILENEATFKQLVQSLFTHRNRKVRNAIAPFIRGGARATNVDNMVKTVKDLPFSGKRVRELAPEDFGALANAIIE